MTYTSKLTLTGARRQLAEVQRRAFALSHSSGALAFDAATSAPIANRLARSRTLSVLGEAELDLVSSAEGIRLLDYLADHADELTEQERRTAYILRRSGEMLRHVNREEYLSYRKLVNEVSGAWAAARENSNFSEAEPWLERLIYAARRLAEQTAPELSPYGFWLDRNEEGLTEERCAHFFDEVREKIAPIAARAFELEPPDTDMLKLRVPPIVQQRIAHFNMEALGVDRNRCRLAVSDHAFTVAFSRYDVRICTRYLPESFTTSLYGVLHECGHALYELSTDASLQFTELGRGASTAVHESQARLYENMVGRSSAWTEFMWPVLAENIPELAEYTPREFFCAVNSAKRTPLRSEADEFSYCLHILIRFEIERGLMNGTLAVHDAPALWNELTAKYLRCEVNSDAEGMLQDPHWAAGQIGYFPTYALGSAAAAQLMAQLRVKADVDACLRRGDVKVINDFLRERIWRYGAQYAPGELMAKALGAPLDVQYYADHLSDKLAEVYGV